MCAGLTWNQKQLTNLLKTNKGRIHRAEKVAESTGAVHDHTHWAAFSCPPKLKLKVSRASIKGRTMPLKAKIERQKTPPFNKLHCNVLCKIRGSLKKTIGYPSQLGNKIQIKITYSCFSFTTSEAFT